MSKKTTEKKGLNGPQVALAAAIIITVLGIGWLVNRSSTTSNTADTKTANAEVSQFTFKEYGVSLSLPTELKGLRYDITRPANPATPDTMVVNVTTDEYTTLANKCVGGAAGTHQSFANLIKSPVTGNTPPSIDNLKQFDDFYIGNLGSSLQNPTCKDAATQKNLTDLTVKLNASLKEAFKSARKA
jgi:hypothetical protein